MSCSYIKSFFDTVSKESIELFVTANKLNDGLNKNEVQLITKSKENRGFFEKIFQKNPYFLCFLKLIELHFYLNLHLTYLT